MKRIKTIIVCLCLTFSVCLTGILNSHAKSAVSWATEPSYDWENVEYFENGTYVFTENGKKGLVDYNGKILIEAKYEDFFCCSCGVVFTDSARKNCLTLADDYTVSSEGEAEGHADHYGFYAYFDGKPVVVSVGNRVTAKEVPEKDGAITFEGVSLTADKKKGGYDASKIKYTGVFGYRTSDGTIVFDGTLSGAVGFENGLGAIKKDGKWAYIDDDGQLLTDFLYSDTKVSNHLHDNNDVYLESEGFIPVCKDEKWGWIDNRGNEVVSAEYDKTTPVYESHAWTCENGKWGILDLSKVVLPVENLTVLGFLSDNGLYVGKSLRIRYTVEPASAEIFWKSSDENTVTVSSDGTATFISVGTAEISACDSEGNVLEKIKVSVENPPVDDNKGISDERLNKLFFILGIVFGIIGIICIALITVIVRKSKKQTVEKTDGKKEN